MQTSFMRRKGAPNTMLIVDDDEMNRSILSMIFEKDHPILEAPNGEEALRIFAGHKGEICAILLDVQMPVMDGITMLKKLAEEHVPGRIPIFLITGETKSAVIQQAYDLGVMDVIPKPFAPPIVQRRVNSVMELFAARNHFADVVAEQTEELREQNQQLQNLNMGMIEALATATEFRSGESGEHVRRIHDITRLLLEKTPLREKFSDEEIRQIALAAILHDVGKISIPDAILNKPGRLTSEEFAVMQQHTVSGDDMLTQIPQLKGLPFYDYARLIARHHHERWDGKGYPDGLSGEDIPIYAQIVGVADVYDALVSQRVYKPPFEHGDAVDMIINGRCGVFNPLLMEYFRECAPAMRELYARRAD